MTNFLPVSVKKNNLIDEFFFCQLLDEEQEVSAGANHSTMATTTVSRIAGSGHHVEISSGVKVETARLSNRVAVPTRVSNTTKMMRPKTPSEATSSAPVTKPLLLVPPPPPLFGKGRIGGKTYFSSPVLSTDPSPGASFHPDFMFCGACTDCKEESDDTPVRILSGNPKYVYKDGMSSDSESKWVDSSDDNVNAFLQTSFQLKELKQQQAFNNATTEQHEQHKHSKILILESLICAIPGVRKIAAPDTHSAVHTSASSPSPNIENIVVHHDASVHMGTIRNAFKSAGYVVMIQHPSTIAGKSLAVSKISKPTKDDKQPNGESEKSNLDMVLKNNGNTLDLDGADSNEPTCWVRSSFEVEGICCASEIPAIRKILKPFAGVAKVNINLTTKVVHVQHNYFQIQASQIALALTEQGFPAQIRKVGSMIAQLESTKMNGSSNDKDKQMHIESVNVMLDRIEKSPFVESTLTIEGLRADQAHWVERAILDSFIRVQVRAVYPSSISETIKIEHNPDLVSIGDIRDFLREHAGNMKAPSHFPSAAEVYIDGAQSNLYLPKVDDYADKPTIRHHGRCFSCMKRYHVNVVLSGVFWMLSMIRVVDGMDRFKVFGLASVLFGLPPTVLKAYRTLRRWQFDANCMMVTAAFGALILGENDEAASVSFLFAVSEFLEGRASRKAREALSEICALRPDHANVIHPISNEIIVVPADQVPLGSLISVRTGDKIAADGIVVEGSTSIDESSLTGESIPVQKKKGDKVSGGTINTGQTQLVIRTTTTVEDSAVSRLIRLVEEAQSNRSPTEMMVDTFARSYTPSIMFIAIIMCTVPWYFGIDIGRQWALNGLIIVVIACPCALTISTPVTYAAGLAATAKRGIIIKGGAILEAIGSVDRIVFDKTGTLTEGKFSVTHINVIGTSKTRREMLELLSLMQERASHPIASSLVQAAKNEGVTVPRQMAVTNHQILKGEGITANIDGRLQVFVGNQRLFNRLGMLESLTSSNKILVNEWKENGGTTGFIGSREDGIIGMFCVKDSVRGEARQALHELKEAGIDAYMCTGDGQSTAQAVAEEVGILGHRVNSGLLPEQKLKFVEGLKRPEPRRLALCRRNHYVLFCGDGVNDAPALAAVDIGVSMGEGAAMALEMSDVTLMDSRLTKLPYVIQMGRRVLRTVKENIAISFVAKCTVVVLTFLGRMTLLYAIASDVGVMLLVTLNGMKLLPNKQFDLRRAKRNRRRRKIMKQNNAYGKNVDFELVRMENSADEPADSIDRDLSEVA
mmetsp:Transcript_26874/g.63133  ORF Transcript_26874/g.63133 Transcript_26874/m.63133 type:complete len:1266 (+) Transcript_26874:148-3945(+)|eukprot:CAMPEP_0197178302 /NCGR_PEP_ID=MMETSP1423-20130617/3621_1 /TAXON_ID=476441 /ORGANISM="Pseudo-nitzschia heimii, Strain UNC1101" /LENGTH=1265 /DNA_ID=CAMNT_0042628011 /DNA_START=70 /DNA_END=3867 /DNA_ORIENTATION=-